MARHGEVYEFGPYVLDAAERRLSNAGRAVTIAPKAHDLLVALVRRAGTLVTKRELLDLVWHDVAVEEGVLSVYISALRKSLDDRGKGSTYIETVPRAAYRFSAAVRRQPGAAEPLSLKWPVGVVPARPDVSELIGRARARLMAASRADVPHAVHAFRSAPELDPNYAAAHAGLAMAHGAQAETDGWLLYGRLLEALGHLADGLAAKQKALEHNPRAAGTHLQIALSYWNQRRYDDMIAWASRSLELDPQHLLAREYLAAAYLKKDDLDRHMLESLTHARAAGAPPDMLDDLRRIYDSDGRPGIVRYALAANAKGPAIQLALLFGELGNLDEAFRQLERAIAGRDPSLVHTAVAPQWDCLRADSRFHERLKGMGLDAASQRARQVLQSKA